MASHEAELDPIALEIALLFAIAGLHATGSRLFGGSEPKDLAVFGEFITDAVVVRIGELLAQHPDDFNQAVAALNGCNARLAKSAAEGAP